MRPITALQNISLLVHNQQHPRIPQQYSFTSIDAAAHPIYSHKYVTAGSHCSMVITDNAASHCNNPHVAPSNYIDNVSPVLQHQIPFMNCENITSRISYAQPTFPQNIYKIHTMPSTTYGQASPVLPSSVYAMHRHLCLHKIIFSHTITRPTLVK